MDEPLEIHSIEHSAKYFCLNIVYELDITAIVDSFLFFSEHKLGHSPTPWANWTRAEAIRWLEFWLRSEDTHSALSSSFNYPESRRLYGEMALRFAEELFPELVYDYEAAKRSRRAWIQKIGEKNASTDWIEYDDDADIEF